ncbi:MAG: hypothetical protein A2698_01680 [Candidatus Levybacteria bacterium RIFCSPHIGHO2_01_FULL_42_15]|nr:MAG: hypothetical protein A2698_01680 [Candidatus Levybacteria bacterium RIFCSPHIGHO2_01_FULL_42_15]
MIILVLFAFLAGVITILSPCILPILPIVLSGSLTGDAKRPFGVIVGFIASFTFFTLFLASIVKATGVSADLLRTISVFIVLGFGISLLIPKAQVLMERLFTTLANRQSSTTQRTGFSGGIFLGISLGIVWAPCVGPILASIITLAIVSKVNFETFLITLAYSVGTAIPMLAVIWGGRSLLQKHPWLLRNSAKIQKIFGIFMIVTALAIFTNTDRKFQAFILEKFPLYGTNLTRFEDVPLVKDQLEKLEQKSDDDRKEGKTITDMFGGSVSAPDFIAGGQWFNSEPLSIKNLRGKVILVDFWTYTCINCIRTLPYLKAWHQKYSDKGLVIIGVHTPEFEFEKNPQNVEKAIKDFGIEYPVMQDNEYATWRVYANRYWPAKYFIDKNGKIRSSHFGEGAYDESEKMIQDLLAEAGSEVTDIAINNPLYQIGAKTPELYLGYERMGYLVESQRVSKNQYQMYAAPPSLPLHRFAFVGSWKIEKERAMPKKGASLSLHFEAKDVFLVMRSQASASKVRVLLNEKPVDQKIQGEDIKNGVVTVSDDRLYKLIRLSSSGSHVLTLEFLDDGIELYASTFG